jgi:tetratricopeptide (TPR) repeat protein
MNIALLEDRLAANPKSPLFARLAFCYLKEGQADKAVEVCTSGLKGHPDYTTAHLILARAFEALGRNVEALIEYRRVLRTFPDNKSIQEQVRTIEQKEQESFRSFAEERLQELRRKKQHLTQQAAHTVQAPVQEQSGMRNDDEPEEEPRGLIGQKIVTVTLAEIYASQGEFGEAIQVYRKLREEKPAEAGIYEKRISELEDLVKQSEAGS